MSKFSRHCRLIVVVCVLLNCNTLRNNFTFDDTFAIVENKDVGGSTSISRLFAHDFWGQDIRSDQSHKSYRPITVLSFRTLVAIARALVPASALTSNHSANGADSQPAPFSTLPFHMANIALHCLVTCLVYRLALQLCHVREAGAASKPAVDICNQSQQTAQGQTGSRQRKRWHDAQDGDARSDTKPQAPQPTHTAEALLAALLFAAHPIHTEAVAGLVGQAELLCAVFFLAALLLHMCAADGQLRGLPTRLAGSARGAQVLLTAAALAMAILAALSKEIGITVVAPMLLYDILLARGHADSHRISDSSIGSGGSLLSWRAAALAGTMAGYIGLRRAVTGGSHLVSIYRKVENPIPFAESAAARALSIGHLHVRYFGLLLAPWRQSADWSFSCVPLVVRLADPRNALTAALYALLAWAAWPAAAAAARSLSATVPTGAATSSAASPQDLCAQTARWRAFVVVGLLVAPFFPSSNALFYVGTFIGERLLYLPSIGFCLLAAQLLTPAPGSGNSRRRLAALACSALLAGYGARTFVRNLDWATEETLFRTAEKVCPDSAKVQLNMGILERRHQNWNPALRHFRKARAIEPGYCEPDFWQGLTLLNSDSIVASPTRTAEGLRLLEESLSCKYVAAKSLQALNQAYLLLHRHSSQEQPVYMLEWARVLVKANRTQEACEVYEQLATAASPQVADSAERLARLCLSAISAAGSQDAALQQLGTCVSARAATRAVLLQHPPSSQQALRVVQLYLQATGASCREAAPRPEAPPEARQRSRAAHMALVHAVQSQHAADPWLQTEWAAVLVEDGRPAEAMQHFQAAGMLFAGQHAAETNAAAIAELGSDMPLPLEARAERSAAAFDEALALQPDARSGCSLLSMKCNALNWLGKQAQRQGQPLPETLTAQLRQCMVALEQAAPLCAAFDMQLKQ